MCAFFFVPRVSQVRKRNKKNKCTCELLDEKSREEGRKEGRKEENSQYKQEKGREEKGSPSLACCTPFAMRSCNMRDMKRE